MGQHAEDLLDWEYRKFTRPHINFYDGPRIPYRRTEIIVKPRWTMLNGNTINIEDMTTQHIVNCINHLDKKGKEPYLALNEELEKRSKG